MKVIKNLCDVAVSSILMTPIPTVETG